MRVKIDVGTFHEPSQGRDGAPPPSASAVRPSPPSVRCAARTAAERRPYLNKVMAPMRVEKTWRLSMNPARGTSPYLAPPVMLITNEFRRDSSRHGRVKIPRRQILAAYDIMMDTLIRHPKYQMQLARWVLVLVFLPVSLTASEPPAVAEFHKGVVPLLQTYCYDCHGDGAKKGNVAFDELTSEQAKIGRASCRERG